MASVPEQPDKKPANESFSFASLTEGLEELPSRPLETDTAPAGDTDEAELRRKELQSRINSRVLGASAPKPSPMWQMGLVASGLAVLLLFFAGNAGVQAYLQPYFSYGVMLLALAAAFWNFTGYRQDGATKTDKIMSGAGVALGVGALVFALVLA